MSTLADVEVACPTCSTVAVRRVVRSVSIGRSPAHREAALDGSLHRFACAGCTKIVEVDTRFSYADFDRSQLFEVYPMRDEPDWAIHEEATMALVARNTEGAAQPHFARELASRLVVRAVFGLDALREKLVVHDLGVDDRDLEAHKLAWMRRDPERRLQRRARPRVIACVGDVLVLATREEGDPLTVTAPMLAGVAPELRQLVSGEAYVDVGRVLRA